MIRYAGLALTIARWRQPSIPDRMKSDLKRIE